MKVIHFHFLQIVASSSNPRQLLVWTEVLSDVLVWLHLDKNQQLSCLSVNVPVLKSNCLITFWSSWMYLCIFHGVAVGLKQFGKKFRVHFKHDFLVSVLNIPVHSIEGCLYFSLVVCPDSKRNGVCIYYAALAVPHSAPPTYLLGLFKELPSELCFRYHF